MDAPGVSISAGPTNPPPVDTTYVDDIFYTVITTLFYTSTTHYNTYNLH